MASQSEASFRLGLLIEAASYPTKVSRVMLGEAQRVAALMPSCEAAVALPAAVEAGEPRQVKALARTALEATNEGKAVAEAAEKAKAEAAAASGHDMSDENGGRALGMALRQLIAHAAAPGPFAQPHGPPRRRTNWASGEAGHDRTPARLRRRPRSWPKTATVSPTRQRASATRSSSGRSRTRAVGEISKAGWG